MKKRFLDWIKKKPRPPNAIHRSHTLDSKMQIDSKLKDVKG